jgi:nuclear transport factor 2 (NTF2) superfamily protein
MSGAGQNSQVGTGEMGKDMGRKQQWPLGRRPDDHPGLSDLGL